MPDALPRAASLGACLARVVARHRRTLEEDIIAAHVCAAEGMFIEDLHRRLAGAGASIPMREHDLLTELGIHPGRQVPPATAATGRRTSAAV